MLTGRATIFSPLIHPTCDGPIGDRAFREGNTVGVSATESRAVTSEVAHAPDLTGKSVFWNQPGSPGSPFPDLRRYRRIPHHGNTAGA